MNQAQQEKAFLKKTISLKKNVDKIGEDLNAEMAMMAYSEDGLKTVFYGVPSFGRVMNRYNAIHEPNEAEGENRVEAFQQAAAALNIEEMNAGQVRELLNHHLLPLQQSCAARSNVLDGGV